MVSAVGYTDEQMDEIANQQDKNGFTDDEMDSFERGNKYSAIESGLAGAQDTALLGYGPNILAGAKTQSFSSPEYISERDRLNSEIEAMKEEDPGTFMTGQIGGGAATLLLPIGAAPKALGIGAQLGRAALIGAGMGAISDTPDVQGQVTSPLSRSDIEERGINALIGGAIGPASEAGISIVKTITPQSVNRAFAALQPRKSMYREARLATENKGLLTKDNIVNFANEEGILKDMPNIQTMYDRSLAARKKYGESLDTIYNKAKQVIDDMSHSGVNKDTINMYKSQKNLDSIKNEIVSEIKSKKWSDVDKEGAIDQISTYFKGLKESVGENPDILQLHDIKTSLGNKSFKEGRAQLPTSIEEFWRTAGRKVDDEIKSRVDFMANTINSKTSDKNLGKFLREANKRYSLSSQLYSMAGDAFDSMAGRNPRDFGDLLGTTLRSPKLQLGLSTLGKGVEAIPQYLKPNAQQVGVAAQQLMTNQNRIPDPMEIYNMRNPPQPTPQEQDQQLKKNKQLPPTERAKARNQIRGG